MSLPVAGVKMTGRHHDLPPDLPARPFATLNLVTIEASQGLVAVAATSWGVAGTLVEDEGT